MAGLLPFIPLCPLAGFLILVLSQGNLPRHWVPWIGAGSVGISALVSAWLGSVFLSGDSAPVAANLWTWMRVGGFAPGFSFHLDALTLAMLFVVTGVGFLIHVYSIGFMAEDAGYARFFAYMNLFVAAMLVLVLADNLVLLYLGWEGVGLCSYLLIGFWYEDPANGSAARKAFVMTRTGDTAMAVGLFLLFTRLGTLDIQPLLQKAGATWATGSPVAVAAALLLLGGAVGKSAQLPLQTWLPDAMAGPTPISALIHAATMVTAGVYLIARMHPLFELAPDVLRLVAAIGAVTLLMAGFSALVQTDIKRILAYSTISQIGYMFLALGVSAWSAAIFHLMTHAYFKALLFLAAGAIIHSFHHEHDIFRMGGLRKRLPVAYWSLLIGGAALAALPFTSGYFSKHAILEAAYQAKGGLWLWGAGVVGALLTGIYTFRLVFVACFGPEESPAEAPLGSSIQAPLWVLCGLALLGGYFAMPLGSVLPRLERAEIHDAGFFLATQSAPWIGIAVAYAFYLSRTLSSPTLATTPWGSRLREFWFNGWDLDRLYGILLVHPFVRLARNNREDGVDTFYLGLAAVCRSGYRMLSVTQTGQLRWYAAGMVGGALVAVALGVWS